MSLILVKNTKQQKSKIRGIIEETFIRMQELKDKEIEEAKILLPKLISAKTKKKLKKQLNKYEWNLNKQLKEKNMKTTIITIEDVISVKKRVIKTLKEQREIYYSLLLGVQEDIKRGEDILDKLEQDLSKLYTIQKEELYSAKDGCSINTNSNTQDELKLTRENFSSIRDKRGAFESGMKKDY